MDPGALAGPVTEFLVPFLAKAAASLAREALTRMPEAVSALWSAVTERFRGRPAAESAANDLTAESDDADSQEAFRLQLKRMLKDDPAFAEQIAGLLNRAQASVNITQEGGGAIATDGSVAVGAGGVGIAGNATAEKNNFITGDKNILVQVNPTFLMTREAGEPKLLAPLDSARAGGVSKHSSPLGLTRESTDRALMSVNRRRLEDLRDLQRELDAYVRAYVDSSKEIPPRISIALAEVRRCREKQRENLALGDDDWDGIKRALAMISTFSMERQALRFDNDYAKGQNELGSALKGARQEIKNAANPSEDFRGMIADLGKAIDYLIVAEVKIEEISRVCHNGATAKLKEIEDLLNEIFRPYELSKEARRPTEGRMAGERSKPLHRNADLRQVPRATRRTT
jgi:hypothetical protein